MLLLTVRYMCPHHQVMTPPSNGQARVPSRYTCYRLQDTADSPITHNLGTVITIWLTFTWFLDFVHPTFRQPALLPSSSENLGRHIRLLS